MSSHIQQAWVWFHSILWGMQQRTVENETIFVWRNWSEEITLPEMTALSMPYMRYKVPKRMADDEHIYLLLGILCPPNYNPGVFPIKDLNYNIQHLVNIHLTFCWNIVPLKISHLFDGFTIFTSRCSSKRSNIYKTN